MTEEVRGSVTGGNGERLELRLGSKSVGLSVRDLIPVLLVILMGVGGYLIFQAIDQRLDLLYARQDLVVKRLLVNEEHARHLVEQLHKMLSVHDWNTGREPHEHLPLVLEPPPKAEP